MTAMTSLNYVVYILLSWSCAGGIVIGFVLSMLLPRMVDPKRLRAEEDEKLVRWLSNPWLSKRIMAPLGQKLWLTRNYALEIGLGATVLALLIGPPPR